jgi:transglutaminase-like putative cysteine protease
MAEHAAERDLPHGALHRNLGRIWLVLLLACIQISLLAIAIAEAGWAPKGAWVTWSMLMAVLLGTLLAISRFSGFVAMVYLLLISLAGASAVTTPLVPAFRLIPTLGFARYVELLNWRVLAFVTQVPGWFHTFLAPSSTLPLKAGQFLLAFAIWVMVAWLLWWALRRRRALIGLLPAGLLTALAIYRQSGKLDLLVAFFFCGLLLIAASAHRRRLVEWDQRHISYPYASIELPLSVLLIAAVVALAARIIPIVATPQGRQSLVEFFQAPPQATPIPAENSQTGSISQPATPVITLWGGIDSMQEIGAPPTSLNDTVLWLQVSTPVSSQGARYYLRGQIFASYTGRGWIPTGEEPYPSTATPILISAHQVTVQQKIEILASHGETLFAINTPVLAGDGTSLVFTQPDSSALLRGLVNRYEVTSTVTHPDASQLEDSGTQYPADLKQTYLRLPTDLPARIGELAEHVTAGAQTPFEKALRIQEYLRTSYPYSLDIPPAPPRQDVVDYFLFDAQGGFCSYYASAMAVMLRLQGVPARIVTGFVASEYLREQGVFRVPASAAHAWVEVYFPGYGWVEFEPTSSQPALQYTAEENPVNPTGVQYRTGTARQWLNRTFSSLISSLTLQITFWCLLGSVAIFVFFRISRFFRPWWLPSNDPIALYWQIRRSMEKVGFTSTASTTPQEFLLLTGQNLPRQTSRLQDSIRITTHNFVLLTFSPYPPKQSSIVKARQTWQRGFVEWLKLWVRFIFKTFLGRTKTRLVLIRSRHRRVDSV